jgi:DNA-directed RNA polymerase subunit RPC12/RpoP
MPEVKVEFRCSKCGRQMGVQKINKAEWKLESFDLGYALVCSNCGRKVGLRKVEMADIDISKCPNCDSEMNLDSLDEDELMEYAKGEFK